MTADRGRAGPLVIVGASLRVAEVAAQLDCQVVHVHKPGASLAPLIDGGTRLFTVEYTTEAFTSLVDEVLTPLKPQAFVSLAEDGLAPAADANARLGLPGTAPEVVARLRDKAKMRRCLHASGLDDLSVRFAEPRNGPQAAQAMAAWGPETAAILKPRTGVASQDIELITSPAQLQTRGDLRARILEEFIPGSEYSAETFSVDGLHSLVAVTEKVIDPTTFVELGHVTPPVTLAPTHHQLVEAALHRFLDAMGLQNGPAHTEFKLHNNTMKIIESHNRIGGDGITTLARLVTGVDLVRWGVGWPVGLGAPSADSQGTAPAAAIAFATTQPGTVTAISLPTDPPPNIRFEFEGVSAFVKPGDEVAALKSSTDRVGCVMASGPNASDTLAAVQALAHEIKVETTPQAAAT